MSDGPPAQSAAADDPLHGVVLICLTATVAGAVIGFVGGAFRWLLQAADRLRLDLVDWAHQVPGPGWLIPVAAAAFGATLAAHYTTPEKIAALIALGSLSVLAENLAPAEGQAHSFDHKADGVTVAYHRDRGEEFDGGETMTAEDFMRDPPDFGQDYTYVHDGEKWLIQGRGKWRPLLDVLAESHD